MSNRFAFAAVLLFAGMVSLFYACGGETAGDGKYSKGELDEQQTLWDGVMSIHDPMMQRMGDINRMTNELQGVLDSEAPVPDSTRQQISAAIENLDAADEGMMNWMNQLKRLDDLRAGTKHQNIIRYLRDQQTAVKKVQNDMLSSIETAQKLLDNFAGQ
ncbi:MAG TPA: hypothetical protein PKE06_20920 [Flavilitoribacter sp.]|nr:hypothetical protein [Flavilitoribacter sp.]HMQ90782.1 hypothetical protein [Flavilitoribacter sp.]